jgi:ADP-ribose pyrophosphatase YjhB (NUDIX family)
MKKQKYGVAVVLVDSESNPKKVYLSRRKGKYENGKYAFPGGVVEESDRSFAEAASRELYEETGLKIPWYRNLQLDVISNHVGQKTDFTIWFLLHLKKDEKPKTTEPEKHEDWTAYNFEELKNLPLMKGTYDLIKDDKLLTYINSKP